MPEKIIKNYNVKYLRDNKVFEIPLTEDLKRHALLAISRIKSMIEKENFKKEILEDVETMDS
ncbi:MAG: hypothetical protein QXN24_00535 [Candidatus Bathyarchaeia archaeon]